jgi:phage shock protein A
MHIFRRLTASFASGIDRAVTAIENHDAVVQASIHDVRRALAQTKGRLTRGRTDGKRLQARVDDLRLSEAKWTERARGRADADEATALECLRRRRECQAQIRDLEQSKAQHAAVEAKLVASLDKIEHRLSELTRQRNLMRTRQAAAEALQATRSIDDACYLVDVDDSLERWEVQITEAELSAELADTTDELEQGFLDEEQRAELRAELMDLKDHKED